jgi:hypothetical protein
MSTLVKYMHRKQINHKVHFVFDSEDAEPIAEIQRTYAEFFRAAPPFYNKYLSGTPHFERDEDVLPLQAADVLAWHVRRAYFASQKNISRKNISVVAKELFEGCERVECRWTDANLKQAVDFILSRRLWRSH